MNITDEIIDYVSSLSKLNLSECEKQKQKRDIQNIIDYIEIINLLDIKELESNYIYQTENKLKEDEIKPSESRTEILLNSPEQKDGYYKIPKAVE